jgi:NADH-quinone oxidoreductase subunit J
VLHTPGPSAAVPGGVEALGRLLFTDYLFPFEVTSVLLLVAIVGVIALAKRKAGTE